MAGPAALARLLQLASPALPVGAYSYSQGLESAIADGAVRDAATAARWIGDVLEFSVVRMEAPLFLRCCEAWAGGEAQGVPVLNAQFLASRESAELRAETVQMGYSLNRLLPDLGLDPLPFEEPVFPVAFSYAATAWGIAAEDALLAYLWSWAENQTMAALKAVPLGQTAGQRMLLELGARLPGLLEQAARDARAEGLPPGNFAPGFALCAARHETLYSRLFRS